MGNGTPIEDIIFDAGGAVFNALNQKLQLTDESGNPLKDDDGTGTHFYGNGEHSDSRATWGLINTIRGVAKDGSGTIYFSSLAGHGKTGDSDGQYLIEPDDKYFGTQLTFPPQVSCQFSNGAMLVVKGVTVVFEGPVIAELRQVFDCQADDKGVMGVVKFAGGTVPHLYPQWWGAMGDGEHDDTDAIQAAIDAVPVLGKEFGGDFGASTAKMSVILPSPQKHYRTTRAIYVHLHHFLLAGEAPGVPIVLDAVNAVPITAENKPNVNNDVLWIKTDEKAASGQANPGLFTGWDEQPSPRQALRNVTIENLNLSSTHPGSNAIYADMTAFLRLKRVSTIGHKGISLFQQSTGHSISGCQFTRLSGCRFEGDPASDKPLVLDKKGGSNLFEDVVFAGASVGLKLSFATKTMLDGCSFEDVGTAIEGLSGKLEGWTEVGEKFGLVPQKQSQVYSLAIRNSRFKGQGQYAMNVDAGYPVLMERCHTTGGAEYAEGKAQAMGILSLAGGGRVSDHDGGGGTLITSKAGYVDIERSSNVYGSVNEVRIAGAVPPFLPGTENEAPNSWFDAFAEKDVWNNFDPIPQANYWEAQDLAGKAMSLEKMSFLPPALSANWGFPGRNAMVLPFHIPCRYKLVQAGIDSLTASNRYHSMLALCGYGNEVVEIVQELRDGDELVAGNTMSLATEYLDWMVAIAAGPMPDASGNSFRGDTYLSIREGTVLPSPFFCLVGSIAVARTSRVGLVRNLAESNTGLGMAETQTSLISIGGGGAIRRHLSALENPKAWTLPSGIYTGEYWFCVIEVKGAAPGDPVMVGFDGTPVSGYLMTGAVTARDKVTVTAYNASGKLLAEPSGTVRVDVWQH